METRPAQRTGWIDRLTLGAISVLLSLYLLAVWPFAMVARLLPSSDDEQEPS